MTLREMVLESAEKEGVAIGLEEAKAEIIENLLLMQRFTVAEIVQLAGVTEDFVLTVKKSLM